MALLFFSPVILSSIHHGGCLLELFLEQPLRPRGPCRFPLPVWLHLYVSEEEPEAPWAAWLSTRWMLRSALGHRGQLFTHAICHLKPSWTSFVPWGSIHSQCHLLPSPPSPSPPREWEAERCIYAKRTVKITRGRCQYEAGTLILGNLYANGIKLGEFFPKFTYVNLWMIIIIIPDYWLIYKITMKTYFNLYVHMFGLLNFLASFPNQPHCLWIPI